MTPTCGRPPQPPPLGKHTKQAKFLPLLNEACFSYDRITGGSDKTSRRITISDTRNFIEDPLPARPHSRGDEAQACWTGFLQGCRQSMPPDAKRDTGPKTRNRAADRSARRAVRKASNRNLKVPEFRRWVAPRKKRLALPISRVQSAERARGVFEQSRGAWKLAPRRNQPCCVALGTDEGNSCSQRAMTTQARQLPRTLTAVRPMSMS